MAFGAANQGNPGISVFRVIPPQEGGWSLMPVENLLRGIRDDGDMVALELFGVDGVVSYGVCTGHPDRMHGVFNAYFPQAGVSSHFMGRVPGEASESDIGDWMHLDEDEFALVQTMGLSWDSYLPLRIFDDREIQQAETDPLAGLIGVISSSSAQG